MDLGHARLNALALKTPPHAFFLVSATFHYLGPAFAVLLFRYVDVLGVAWLRIVSAAVIFCLWRRPWPVFRRLPRGELLTLLGLGVVLALMNSVFYLAIDRLPLSTVGAIEFMGPILLAAVAIRDLRNLTALALAATGVFLLTDVRIAGEPIGFILAFANCALFIAYVVLGHKVARSGSVDGIDQLGAAMLVAAVVALPIGIQGAMPALVDPTLMAAAIGVGICSSVIPYVCDQLAMARLSRAAFALLLSLLPATATLIGVVVLGQIPGIAEGIGIVLVVAGVALHRSPH